MEKKMDWLKWPLEHYPISLLIVGILFLLGIFGMYDMPKDEFPHATIRQGVVAHHFSCHQCLQGHQLQRLGERLSCGGSRAPHPRRILDQPHHRCPCREGRFCQSHHPPPRLQETHRQGSHRFLISSKISFAVVRNVSVWVAFCFVVVTFCAFCYNNPSHVTCSISKIFVPLYDVRADY